MNDPSAPQYVFPAAVAPPKKRYLPTNKVDYFRILRSPQYRVWKPFASFGIVLTISAGVLALSIIAIIVFVSITGARNTVSPDDISQQTIDIYGLIDFLYGNLLLASLIPIVMFSSWVIHRTRPGYISSVTGKFRWKWFGWCLLVIVPIWTLNLGMTAGLNYLLGYETYSIEIDNPGLVVAFLISVFLTTPLQAAGEEYLIRGWLSQNIGAFFKDKWTSISIATLVSTFVFAFLHLNLNPFAIIFYISLSLTASAMTYKTGGLEAAVALHAIHNIIVFHLMIFLQDSIERSVFLELGLAAVTVGTHGIFYFIVAFAIIYLAKRKNITEEFIPNENEVAKYNYESQQYSQQIYLQQYQLYLQRVEHYNAYRAYWDNYYAHYYGQK